MKLKFCKRKLIMQYIKQLLEITTIKSFIYKANIILKKKKKLSKKTSQSYIQNERASKKGIPRSILKYQNSFRAKVRKLKMLINYKIRNKKFTKKKKIALWRVQ